MAYAAAQPELGAPCENCRAVHQQTKQVLAGLKHKYGQMARLRSWEGQRYDFSRARQTRLAGVNARENWARRWQLLQL